MLAKITCRKALNGGVTLTEVMIAVFIFAVCLVGLAKLSGSLFTINNYAQQRTEALNFAQQKIAQLKNFATIDTTAGYNAYQDIVTGSDTVSGVNATYTRNWTVTENTSVGYKTVTVTVSWTTQDNSSKSVSVNSIIGRNDPGTSGTLIKASSSGGITS